MKPLTLGLISYFFLVSLLSVHVAPLLFGISPIISFDQAWLGAWGSIVLSGIAAAWCSFSTPDYLGDDRSHYRLPAFDWPWLVFVISLALVWPTNRYSPGPGSLIYHGREYCLFPLLLLIGRGIFLIWRKK